MEYDNSSTLQEPLLEKDVEENLKDDCCSNDNGPGDEEAAPRRSRGHHDDGEEVAAAVNPNNNNETATDDDDPSSSTSSSTSVSFLVFTVAAELAEMANLAWPLAVSFFCRMGMASTDSAFVGHIHDQHRYVFMFLLRYVTVVVVFVVECLRVSSDEVCWCDAVRCDNPYVFFRSFSFFWLTFFFFFSLGLSHF
jgi:hypothetical protein